MKHILPVILAISIFITSCSTKSRFSDERTDSAVLEIKQFVDKLLPEVIAFSEWEDEDNPQQWFTEEMLAERFPERNLSLWDDLSIFESDSLGNDVIVTSVGRFVDDTNIFAAVYSEPDSLFCFFRLEDKKWKEVGRKEQGAFVILFQSEELNGKPGYELLASSSMNMNGNVWSTVFTYLKDEDEIRFAGDICTSYEFNAADSTVHEEYAGSWYMDVHKTIYIWHNNMLVPYRHAVIVVPKNMEPPFEWTFEYYENPELKYGVELQLVYSETYSDEIYGEEVEHTKQFLKYWENFFELGRSPLGMYKPD